MNSREAPGPGQLRPYTLPSVHRQTLPGDLTVLHAEQRGSGLITALVVVDAGTIRERPEQAGLASLTAESLDEGAAGRTGEELAWQLEQLGVEPETEASWDASWIGATIQSERLDAALAILADIVQRPEFPERQVDRVRGEQLAVILQRRKEPRALASDMMLRFLYGDAEAYGRPSVGIAERVRHLTWADAVAFHRQNFAPGRTAVLLIGDVEQGRAVGAVQTAFAAWRGNGVPVTPPATPRSAGGGVIHVVDRPGSVQSEIRAAHAGVDRRHPDYFALRVMNTILGGAFMSRLNLNLRERNGFTYGVRSGFSFRRAPGPFLVQTAVATDVTDRALVEILREIELLQNEGVREEEVSNARDYVAGVLPLELQTTQQIAARFADLVIHDLPDDYFQGYRAAIQAVTVDDVVRVARTHLDTGRLTVCIVGDGAAVQAPLAATGRGRVEIHAVPD
jgi:zinc protease